MRRAQLYFHTLRYLRPGQVPARARLRVGRAVRECAPGLTGRWRKHRGARIPLPDVPPPVSAPRPLDAEGMAQVKQVAEAWQAGTPRYLNTSVSVGWPPRWAATDASQLWRYHLHYFDEAPLLAQGDADARETLRTLVSHWADSVPCGAREHRDAWHPYVVSLRLVNWLLAWIYAPSVFADDRRVADSLRDHAVFLGANLETDVGGNHLLKNLKALAIAGACWPGWQAPAATLDPFVAALRAQLLADGVHYERSPMYHCQVLGDAIEVLLVLRATGHEQPDALRSEVGRMVEALRGLTHPDGDIALLGDSALDMSFAPSELEAAWGDLLDVPTPDRPALRHRPLLRHAAADARTSRPSGPLVPDGPLRVHAARHPDMHSGLVVLASPRVHVLADVGALCPDELPAHAQADTFTFELSLDSLRLIVDAGVDEYAPGPWRTYYRSTPAHNTVSVDGEDSSECWGSFRAARRARVAGATLTTRGGWRTLSGRHDGYRRLASPVTHERTFALHETGVFVVRDALEGPGAHRIDTFLHLHPETDVQPGAGANDLILRRRQAAVRLAWSGHVPPVVRSGVVSPPQGWYGERFGARRPAPVLIWSATGPEPRLSAFALAPLDVAPVAAGFEVSPAGVVSAGRGTPSLDAFTPPESS